MAKRNKPSYSDTLKYRNNTKYANKDMFMSDNENNFIIEDEISRDKRWKEHHQKEADRLISLNAPEFLIEERLLMVKLGEHGWKAYCKKRAEEHKKYVKAYIKQFKPFKPEIVEKVLKDFDKLLNADEVKPHMYSTICFNRELDPLKHIDEYEFWNGIWDKFLNSLHQKYIKKWKRQIDFSYGDIAEDAIYPKPWEE
jgi:hypothetical protein